MPENGKTPEQRLANRERIAQTVRRRLVTEGIEAILIDILESVPNYGEPEVLERLGMTGVAEVTLGET